MSEFDLVVHQRDSKTGRVLSENPYILHCSRENGHLFERGGKLYTPDGKYLRDVAIKAAAVVADVAVDKKKDEKKTG